MNPLIVGDIVEFVPSSRSAGYQGDVRAGGISAGYVGEIAIIRDGEYVFFEDDKGGAPFTEFRLVRKAANARSGELGCSSNPFRPGSTVIFCPKHIALNEDPRFFPYGLKPGDSGTISNVDRHLVWLTGIPAPMPWWFVKSPDRE